MTDGQFLVKIEKRQLARSEWTHEAHVRMAWLYVTKTESYRDARSKVRTGIKKLSATFQVQSAAPCGATQPAEPATEAKPISFHETITTAFVRLISARARPGETFTTFRKRNPELFDRKLSALLKHYSPKLLFSEEAKTTFAQPDLEPLPKPWLAKV